MRVTELEYRGMHSHDNKWAYGCLIISNRGTPYIYPKDIIEQDGHHIRFDDDEAHWVHPESVGLYSSLRDLNGKKLFSGDILQFNDECGIWIGVVCFTRGLFGIDICNVKQIKNPDDWDKPYDKIKSRHWGFQWGYEEYGTAFCYREPLAKRTLYTEGRPDDNETYNNSEYYKWHKKHGFGEYRVDAEIVGNYYENPGLLEGQS